MSTISDNRPPSPGAIANTVGMTDTITLTGVVATMPENTTTSENLRITRFRLASPQRYFDRAQQRWVDGDTNWYRVSAFRQLAENVSQSLAKGERVIVTGKLRIREWTSGERSGRSIDVEAESIGHDLTWGTSTFTRNLKVAAAPGQSADGAVVGGAGPRVEDEDVDAGAPDVEGGFGGFGDSNRSESVGPIVDDVPVPF
jgi:single-strand DNA-binding protein